MEKSNFKKKISDKVVEIVRLAVNHRLKSIKGIGCYDYPEEECQDVYDMAFALKEVLNGMRYVLDDNNPSYEGKYTHQIVYSYIDSMIDAMDKLADGIIEGIDMQGVHCR